ncbi:MAG: hypothetical protein A2284_03865 [Deltaproteobacteria bacterium RIFOXYA12_FULL_61_11]|nr:MAG: hypothetical protein A2284_03865 [Deltaproteobacteria bacterium RIFOXYA12_FULL_61_11]
MEETKVFNKLYGVLREAAGRKTDAVLQILPAGEGGQGRIWLEGGRIVYADPGYRYDRAEAVLQYLGLLDANDLLEATSTCEDLDDECKVAAALIEAGLITEAQFENALRIGLLHRTAAMLAWRRVEVVPEEPPEQEKTWWHNLRVDPEEVFEHLRRIVDGEPWYEDMDWGVRELVVPEDTMVSPLFLFRRAGYVAASGVFTIRAGEREKRCTLENGKLVSIESTDKADLLVNVLVRFGFVSAEAMRGYVEIAKQRKENLSAILLGEGALDEPTLKKATLVQRQTQVLGFFGWNPARTSWTPAKSEVHEPATVKTKEAPEPSVHVSAARPKPKVERIEDEDDPPKTLRKAPTTAPGSGKGVKPKKGSQISLNGETLTMVYTDVQLLLEDIDAVFTAGSYTLEGSYDLPEGSFFDLQLVLKFGPEQREVKGKVFLHKLRKDSIQFSIMEREQLVGKLRTLLKELRGVLKDKQVVGKLLEHSPAGQGLDRLRHMLLRSKTLYKKNPGLFLGAALGLVLLTQIPRFFGGEGKPMFEGNAAYRYDDIEYVKADKFNVYIKFTSQPSLMIISDENISQCDWALQKRVRPWIEREEE